MEQGANQYKLMFEKASDEIKKLWSAIEYISKHNTAVGCLLFEAHRECPSTWRGYYDDALTHSDIIDKHLSNLRTPEYIGLKTAALDSVAHLSGFSLHLTREEWGHVYDGLILERERSIQRKSANPESNSDEISKACEEVMARIRRMSEIN